MTAQPNHLQDSGAKDLMQYFVLCRYKTGLQWAARDPANMDRKNTMDDICSGELPDVVTVLECNPVENICNNVTEDILAECLKQNFIAMGETGQDAIDWQRDHARAMKESV